MARLLILGAGASVPACYPLTDALLERIGQEAATSHFLQLSTAWEAWCQYLQNLPHELEILKAALNPELILSFTDLFDVAASEEDRRRTIEAVHNFEKTGQADPAPLETYFTSSGRDLAGMARQGKSRLLEALTWYFAFRHMEDHKAHRSHRDYLRPHLNPLKRGDAILTFNWDSLAERTLAEDGRWSPLDGYGFSRQLLRAEGPERRVPVPNSSLPISDVIVLKLHGSFGWRTVPEGKGLFLDANFLQCFGCTNPNDLALLRDAAEPESYSPTDPVVEYPSYLKQLSHPTLQVIWRTAASYLERAEYVEVIGYGLPTSDAAARSLLLPVAQHVRGGQVRAVIRDPSSDTLKRWKELLGSKAELRQETIERTSST